MSTTLKRIPSLIALKQLSTYTGISVERLSEMTEDDRRGIRSIFKMLRKNVDDEIKEMEELEKRKKRKKSAS